MKSFFIGLLTFLLVVSLGLNVYMLCDAYMMHTNIANFGFERGIIETLKDVFYYSLWSVQ